MIVSEILEDRNTVITNTAIILCVITTFHVVGFLFFIRPEIAGLSITIIYKSTAIKKLIKCVSWGS